VETTKGLSEGFSGVYSCSDYYPMYYGNQQECMSEGSVYRAEGKLQEGTCEVYDGMDNTSKSPRIPCIALCLSNNTTGSWEFLSLTSNKRIRRTQWQKMVTSEVIINMMNNYDPSGDIEGDVNEEQLVEQHVEVPTMNMQEVPVQVPGTEIVEDIDIDPIPESTNVQTETASTSVQPVGSVPDVGLTTLDPDTDTDMSELEPQGKNDSDNEAEEEEHEQQPPRCSARIAQGIMKPSKYAMASVGTSVLTKE
jgi:hypothetical protein